ncbi:hypothetical protein C8F01DRAFT_1100888 [Mycena amicta]|nr:hypothetical protein C8F01DRAFT_1100888 [Mycena amicta]
MSLPTFSFESTAQEVSTALKGQISGRNVLITGTSLNGIGFEAARAIAPYANLVVITGYNAERLKLSEEALKKEFPSAKIRTLTLDLSSMASVRKAAAEVNAYPEPLHVLIHNAATIGSYYITEDDFEIQGATAQFGPFLLTKLIAPKLLSARTKSFVPRVIYVSSNAHGMGITGIDFSKLRHGYPPEDASTAPGMMKRYSEVKSMNMMMAVELSRRAKGQLRAYSLHPGMIPTNALDKEAPRPLLRSLGVITEDGKPKENDFAPWKTLPQGAATTVVAAFDPRLDDKAGVYLIDCTVAPEDKVSPHAIDPANAEKLWNLTEEILGEKFEFS